MGVADYFVFVVYFIAMLGVGLYFTRRNKSSSDYFVGGRSMGAGHVGLSVVATDVGGGFSIGLGGLGFTMGLSGSWMLFTGLVGAWLSAVFLIPKVAGLGRAKNLLTFPQFLGEFYNARVVAAAAWISAIGYIGFTSSQMLAGAKLASATFDQLDLTTALLFMGVIAVVYTVLGGIKAVIYTDTVQWILLMSGLVFIGIPLGYKAIGGWSAIEATLGPSFLSLGNVTWQQLVNWGVTIVPIWFVGMTLYQRIFACRSAQEARKAWFVAGLFEWPVMAFMGVALGLFSRVALETGMFATLGHGDAAGFDAEMGLPLLLRSILPTGLLGLMMSAYFSAIMSTADSCLMAASGNVVTDLLPRSVARLSSASKRWNVLRLSQLATLLIGVLALALATRMQNVLELMLYSYAFMVSGLFVPVLMALFGKKPSSSAALVAMVGGGATTLALIAADVALPLGLDANLFGIAASAMLYFTMKKIDDGTKS